MREVGEEKAHKVHVTGLGGEMGSNEPEFLKAK